MKIISHRGYWHTIPEKNSMAAFELSFALGFGIETDVRDFDGRPVISHDLASVECPSLEAMLELHKRINPSLPLALNIKADGLQDSLSVLLARYQVENYFVFDMSIPDTLAYRKAGIRYFTRESEYEPTPALYDQASGVWMDCFLDDWIADSHISRHLQAGKQVCLVSPELHRREHQPFWDRLVQMPSAASENLILCTDYPEKAREQFRDKH